MSICSVDVFKNGMSPCDQKSLGHAGVSSHHRISQGDHNQRKKERSRSIIELGLSGRKALIAQSNYIQRQNKYREIVGLPERKIS